MKTLQEQRTESVLKMQERITKLEKENAKAKELLAEWVELFKPKSETALPTPIQVDTEHFLNSDMEK